MSAFSSSMTFLGFRSRSVAVLEHRPSVGGIRRLISWGVTRCLQSGEHLYTNSNQPVGFNVLHIPSTASVIEHPQTYGPQINTFLTVHMHVYCKHCGTNSPVSHFHHVIHRVAYQMKAYRVEGAKTLLLRSVVLSYPTEISTP